MPPRESKRWALVNIKVPHPHDVLSGRGGGTNHHAGNVRYRQLVEERKMEYVNSERLDKPKVAAEIVRIVRQQNPPGRFLKQNETTKLWSDVGDKEAQKKVSQALREGAAEIRQQQEQAEVDSNAESEEVSNEQLGNACVRVKPEESTRVMQIASTANIPLVKQAIMSRYETRTSVRSKIISPLRGDLKKKMVDSDLSGNLNGSKSFPPAVRPTPIKRTTSHDNERADTKRDLRGVSVKRTALSRDNSLTSRALKEAILRAHPGTSRNEEDREEQQKSSSASVLPPRYPSERPSLEPDDSVDTNRYSSQDGRIQPAMERDENDVDCGSSAKEICSSDRELRRLSDTLEQTTLGGFIAPARQFSDEERMRDMDVLYAELADETAYETALL